MKSLRPTHHQLHWTLDVTFQEDQSRLRTGHGARNMAVVRHFAINLVRKADDQHLPCPGMRKTTAKPRKPAKASIRLRRKYAGWDLAFLETVLAAKIC